MSTDLKRKSYSKLPSRSRPPDSEKTLSVQPIRRLSITQVQEALDPYFTELKLADIVYAYIGNPFISTWNIHQDDEDRSIILPLLPDGTYNFLVFWGDGTSSRIKSAHQPEVKHHYSCPGDYTIQLSGVIQGFSFNIPNTKYKHHISCQQIIEISQWGCVRLGTCGSQFRGCRFLDITALDTPDLTRVTDMSWCFFRAEELTGGPAGRASAQ